MEELIQEYHQLRSKVNRLTKSKAHFTGTAIDEALDRLSDLELELAEQLGITVDMGKYEPEVIATQVHAKLSAL